MAIDLSNYESGKKYEGIYEEDLKALQDRLSRLQSLHILLIYLRMLLFKFVFFGCHPCASSP